MGLPNGVHHLALGTRDMKAQIEFFTQVVGMELVALFWMHGVPGTFHGFLRLGDTCSLAFVQMPVMKETEPQLGVSHAGSPAGPVAGGAMQHIAFNVDSEADLLALRDRIRANGYWVMGPIDHGMCKSMYLAAPEGIVLEFATTTTALDADEWIDPEVVALCGIDAEELARYRAPSGFEDRDGAVPQPDAGARPGLVLPPGMEVLLKMSDAEISAAMDFPNPPVPKQPAA